MGQSRKDISSSADERINSFVGNNSNNLALILGTHAKDFLKPYLDAVSLFALSKTNLFLNQNLRELLPKRRYVEFLQAISNNDIKKVIFIMDRWPEFMFLDPTLFEVKNITMTGWQLAIALDASKVTQILASYIDEFSDGEIKKTLALEQWNAIEKRAYDFEPLMEVLKLEFISSDSVIDPSKEMQKTFSKFHKAMLGEKMLNSGMHYNPEATLMAAHEIYRKNVGKLNIKQANFFVVKVLGFLFRLASKELQQEYLCDIDIEINESEKVKVINEFAIPLRDIHSYLSFHLQNKQLREPELDYDHVFLAKDEKIFYLDHETKIIDYTSPRQLKMEDHILSSRKKIFDNIKEHLKLFPYWYPGDVKPNASHQEKGDWHFSRKYLVKTKMEYIKAHYLEPNNAEHHFNLGKAYDEWKEKLLAKIHYLQCLNINPEHKMAAYKLALIFEKENVFEEMEMYFLLALNNSDLDAATKSSVYTKMGSNKKVSDKNRIYYIWQAISLDPGNENAIKLFNHYFEDKKVILANIKKLGPARQKKLLVDSLDATTLLGQKMFSYLKGNIKRAIYQQLKKISGARNFSEAFFNSKCIEYMERTKPKDNLAAIRYQADLRYAEFENGLDKSMSLDMALSQYLYISEFNRENETYYFNRAHIYYTRNEIEKAIDDFTQAVKLNPNNASNYHSRAMCYLGKKDIGNAISDFNDALKLTSGFDVKLIKSTLKGIFYEYGNQKILDAIKRLPIAQQKIVLTDCINKSTALGEIFYENEPASGLFKKSIIPQIVRYLDQLTVKKEDKRAERK